MKHIGVFVMSVFMVVAIAWPVYKSRLIAWVTTKIHEHKGTEMADNESNTDPLSGAKAAVGALIADSSLAVPASSSDETLTEPASDLVASDESGHSDANDYEGALAVLAKPPIPQLDPAVAAVVAAQAAAADPQEASVLQAILDAQPVAAEVIADPVSANGQEPKAPASGDTDPGVISAPVASIPHQVKKLDDNSLMIAAKLTVLIAKLAPVLSGTPSLSSYPGSQVNGSPLADELSNTNLSLVAIADLLDKITAAVEL